MSKHCNEKRIFKVAVGVYAGVVFGGILLVFLLMCLYHKDCFLQQSGQAQRLVRDLLGDTATSNEYYVDFIILQGTGPRYYRCETTPEAVQAYIKRMGLLPVSDSQSIRAFRNGSPYWWNPGRGKHVEYYGTEGKKCVISWDKRTGQCHILRDG